MDLSNLKRNFANRYPDHPLTAILLNTSDEVSEQTFLELVKIWLKILNKR